MVVTSGGASGDEAPGATGERPPHRLWVELLVLLVVVLMTIGGVRSFLLQAFSIPSRSMEQTLQIGDRVLVNKWPFAGPVRRGDVVVFDGVGSFLPADAPRADFVKRVLGVPGDRVACCDPHGLLTVNGAPLEEESYLFPGDVASLQEFDVRVPPESLWVMGDHRSESEDSRDHLGEPGGGMVPLDRVVGRAVALAWPPGRVEWLDRPEIFDEPAPAGDGTARP